MTEILKAKDRREREGWYDKFAPPNAKGIDIGGGCKPQTQLHPDNENWTVWDMCKGDGDATFMKGVPNNHYDVVHASHILEHVKNPKRALFNWYRILKPGGHLIVLVPHRDLYEKKLAPPSRWNHDHKTFWVPHRPEEDAPPTTKGLLDEILGALPRARVIQLRILDEGFKSAGDYEHSLGEYSIEAIVRKVLS